MSVALTWWSRIRHYASVLASRLARRPYSGRRDWPGDPGVRQRRQRLVTFLSQLLDELRSDEAVPPMTIAFVRALMSRSEGAADARSRIGQHASPSR